MKIATITCHDVYNYGASLQAYALQEYFTGLGHDYIIIDYKPPYLSNHYKFGTVGNPRFDKPLLKQLYLLAKFPGRLRERKRKYLFDDFRNRYLKLTPVRYSSSDMLKENCPAADLYIAGSDQIWNTIFPNGKDAAFYLDFVGDKGRKISYAASFATDRIYDGYESFVRKMIKNLDAVSVRESGAIDILRQLDRTDGVLVCDPVFLLSEKQWCELIPEKQNGKKAQILVYDCEKSPALREIALELKRKTGLEIHTVSNTYGHYADKNFELSGPIEFLSLLHNARYVVANSFHALAFSLIFNKDFFIVKRSEKINSRMQDFLSYLSLNERLVSSPAGISPDPIDFEPVNRRLHNLIKESENYISEQIPNNK